MKSLFTLYRWFFRFWYEPKYLKWWQSFLCQGVHSLYISWYPRDLCNFFSTVRVLLMTLLIRLDCQAMGIYLSLFPTKKVYSLLVNLHKLNCQKGHHYRQQFLVAHNFLNLEYLFGIFLFFAFFTTLLACFSCYSIEINSLTS